MSTTMSPTLEFVKACVETKRPLEIYYQGLQRIVCPYMLAKTTDGRFVLQALQTGGFSSKGPVTEPAWRWLYFDQMQSLSGVTGVPWTGTLVKSETPYKPPKFVAEIIAITTEMAAVSSKE